MTKTEVRCILAGIAACIPLRLCADQFPVHGARAMAATSVPTRARTGAGVASGGRLAPYIAYIPSPSDSEFDDAAGVGLAYETMISPAVSFSMRGGYEEWTSNVGEDATVVPPGVRLVLHAGAAGAEAVFSAAFGVDYLIVDDLDSYDYDNALGATLGGGVRFPLAGAADIEGGIEYRIPVQDSSPASGSDASDLGFDGLIARIGLGLVF